MTTLLPFRGHVAVGSRMPALAIAEDLDAAVLACPLLANLCLYGSFPSNVPKKLVATTVSYAVPTAPAEGTICDPRRRPRTRTAHQPRRGSWRKCASCAWTRGHDVTVGLL